MTFHKVPPRLIVNEERPTQREFLSVIMPVFDPLGFLAPFLIRSKILMQQVWISGIGWDQPLQDNEFGKWKGWLRDLEGIKQCSIPRYYIRSQLGVERLELHVFCDASSKAYAAVCYWRIKLSDGSVRTSLIASRSRVAPLKPLLIPRLELQAARLATRLAYTVEKYHNLKASRRFFWSDSSTVFSWIKSDPRRYQTFVAHRLGEKAEFTSPEEWRWAPTDLNPADDATRETSSCLAKNERWLRDPLIYSKTKRRGLRCALARRPRAKNYLNKRENQLLSQSQSLRRRSYGYRIRRDFLNGSDFYMRLLVCSSLSSAGKPRSSALG